MDPYETAALTTAIAISIAKNTPDNGELAFISLVFAQISNTLDTIVAQRELIAKAEGKGNANNNELIDLLVE